MYSIVIKSVIDINNNISALLIVKLIFYIQLCEIKDTFHNYDI